MVTVTLPGVPIVTSLGSDNILMASSNVSLASKVLSSNIKTLNVALVIPAINVTGYGPG